MKPMIDGWLITTSMLIASRYLHRPWWESAIVERTAEQAQFLVPAVEILFVEVFFNFGCTFVLQSFLLLWPLYASM